MSQEIERKFLVKKHLLTLPETGISIKQGYFKSNGNYVIRIRILENKAFITIKSKKPGLTRQEFEYPIPINDAYEMLSAFCSDNLIEKTRYELHINDLTWEIDDFHGNLEGLTVAEIELPTEQTEVFLPDWIDREVTHEANFYNYNLSKAGIKPIKPQT